jgi:hypothetical protein
MKIFYIQLGRNEILFLKIIQITIENEVTKLERFYIIDLSSSEGSSKKQIILDTFRQKS